MMAVALAALEIGLKQAPASGWISLVCGALFTAMTYISFSSVVKIRSENFIATSAFMPLATFGMQTLAASLAIIPLPAFDWRLFPAIAGAIAGVMLMIWGGRRRP